MRGTLTVCDMCGRDTKEPAAPGWLDVAIGFDGSRIVVDVCPGDCRKLPLEKIEKRARELTRR